MSRVVEIKSEQELNRFIAHNDRVVVFYGAPWCQACTSSEPLYARIAKRYESRIALAHIDIEECGIKIENIPFFLAFYKTEVVDSLEGVNSYLLKRFIKQAIKYKPPRGKK